MRPLFVRCPAIVLVLACAAISPAPASPASASAAGAIGAAAGIQSGNICDLDVSDPSSPSCVDNCSSPYEPCTGDASSKFLIDGELFYCPNCPGGDCKPTFFVPYTGDPTFQCSKLDCTGSCTVINESCDCS